MNKYIRYPEYFDSIQFMKVLSKANDYAWEIDHYQKADDSYVRELHLKAAYEERSAFLFATELLDYDIKAIFDTLRIVRKLENIDYWRYDEADIYVYLTEYV